MASDRRGAGCIDAGVCRLSIFEHSENAGHGEGRHLGDPRGDKAGRPPFGNSSWRAICRIRPGGLKADNAMKVTDPSGNRDTIALRVCSGNVASPTGTITSLNPRKANISGTWRMLWSKHPW